MKNLFEDVQHRFDVLSINQTEADDKFLNAVHNSNQSLILRHDRSHQMVQNLHDNILAQFKQLQLSVTTEREKKTISTDLVPVTSTMELNKLYVLLIMGLVRELAK